MLGPQKRLRGAAERQQEYVERLVDKYVVKTTGLDGKRWFHRILESYLIVLTAILIIRPDYKRVLRLNPVARGNNDLPLPDGQAGQVGATRQESLIRPERRSGIEGGQQTTIQCMLQTFKEILPREV